MVDLAQGTQLFFTDSGYDGTHEYFRDTEGTLAYTVPAPGASAGDVVVWEDGTSDPAWSAISGNFALSGSGDSIL
eukprot:4074443-Prorocentrum_lima.AAC.1